MEPPVSEPATAEPEPLDEPPVMWSVFQGLRGVPAISLWPVGPVANSTICSRATSKAPAVSSFLSAVDVMSGT